MDAHTQLRDNNLKIGGIYPSPLKELEYFFEMDYKYAYEISGAH